MSSGILAQLAAKRRRHVVVPVEVKAATEDQLLRAHELRTRLVAAAIKETTRSDGDVSAEVQQLTDELEGIENENRVQVAFTALEPEEFEKVAAVYPSPLGADSGMDWKAALPVLAALCADEPELQEDGVWRDLLKDWNHGEKVTLWGALLRLNVYAPEPHVPKG